MKVSNKLRRLLSSGFAAIAAAVIFGGCTEVDDTLGANLVPDDQQMKMGYVSLPAVDRVQAAKKYVETRLFQTDSILASNLSNGYMGQTLNDTLGRRTVGFLSQYLNYYRVDSGYFGYKPIFDSAQILLSIASYGADTLTDQTFAVYEVLSNRYLTEKPVAAGKSERDTAFYLDFDPVKEGVYDPARKLFTFTIGQSNGTGPATTAVTMQPTREGREFIQRLMLQQGANKGDYSIYSADSVEQWVEAFKGLYICPDPDAPLSEYGKGTIYATELSSSGFSVYGRNRLEADPSLIKDTIGMVYYFYDSYAEYGNVSINTVSRNYDEATSTSVRIDLDEARETAENRPENPLVHVEGLGGVVTEMTFTQAFFDDLQALLDTENAATGKNFKTIAFSQVVMSVYFCGSDYDWTTIDPAGSMRLIEEMNAAPARLGLYTDFKKLTPIADYAYVYENSYGTTLSYGGYISRSRGCYTMDITGYAQELWNNYQQEKLAAAEEGRAVDLSKVDKRTVYIGPEAYGLFNTPFGIFQGSTTDASSPVPNNAPIRFDVTYNMIK